MVQSLHVVGENVGHRTLGGNEDGKAAVNGWSDNSGHRK